jgi:hypothetical protein
MGGVRTEDRMEDAGEAGRYGVVIDRILAEAEDDDSVCDLSVGVGCDDGVAREDAGRYGLVLDRLFAVADERVYGTEEPEVGGRYGGGGVPA